jgi:hypothetical protein
MSDEIIRECLIETIKLLKEFQKDMTDSLDKIAALEEAMRAADPKHAQAFEERVAVHRRLSMPFDEDESMRRFDALIEKLKGA